MQKHAVHKKSAIRRKAGWLLVVYVFCSFHHQLADVAHELSHLAEHVFEHHHHDHDHLFHHHATYLEEVAEIAESDIHHQKSSPHSHPILAFFDWEDDQDDPGNATAPEPLKNRKSIDQHLGVFTTDGPLPTRETASKRYFLVKINRSLPHPFLITPPPEIV